MDSEQNCCPPSGNWDCHGVRRMLLHEATKFCPQIMDTREKLEAPMILKKVAVSFVVTLLEGVAEFIDHLEVSASISRFEACASLWLLGR